MDGRRYLDLEAALCRKLRMAWRRQATALWAQVDALLVQGKYDDARRLADQIDFRAIGEQYRGWVKYLLWATAVFGAKQVAKDPALSSLSAESLLQQVADNYVAALGYQITPAVRDQLNHTCDLAQQVARKDDTRYVKEFVSFVREGDSRLQLISSLHTSRLATWGFAAEAEIRGVTTYRITAVLDGRTSAFCRAIDGKTFRVEDASRSINTILRVQDPNDVRNLQPWPAQDANSIERYKGMSAAQLTSLSLHIPPFHPHCRTYLVMVGKTKEIPRVETQEVPMQRQSESDFTSLGFKITPDDLTKWNRIIGLPPMQVLANLTGRDVDLLVGAFSRKFFAFKKDGSVAFKVTQDMADGGMAAVSQVFDPYVGALYLTQADLRSNSPAAADYLHDLYQGAVTNARALRATEFTLATDGKFGLYTHAQFGFVPSAVEWSRLKNDLLMDLGDGGRLAYLWEVLPASVAGALKLILNTPDGRGLWALSDLTYEVAGVELGRILLEGRNLTVSLPLEDADAMDRFGGFIHA